MATDDIDIYFNTNIKDFYKNFVEKLEDDKNIYNLTAVFYENKSLYLTIPTITLTSLAGMGSFFSAVSFINDDTKTGFNLGVGIIGSIASLLQTFNAAFKFNTKAEMFRTAADLYDKLITQTKFEILNPNENNFMEKLEKKMLEIQNNCKYFPPQQVVDNYYKNKIFSPSSKTVNC